MLSEMIFGVFVFLAYFGLVESNRVREDTNTKSEIEGNNVVRIHARTLEKDQREKETIRAQAEAELALKHAEMQAREEERMRKQLEAEALAIARQEAEEAQRLKQIEDARRKAEAEQAVRLREAEEAKKRAFEEEKIQKKIEEAARLQADAEEAARLQAELEEASRKQAEAEAKRKAEEKAARIHALEAEARKLEQIEEVRALAEAEQTARLQAELEYKAKAQEKKNARIEAEEKVRLMAEQKLKEEADEESDAEEHLKNETNTTLDNSFDGSMGYLAHTDTGALAELSMRVRILNETTRRSRDLLVPVTSDLTIEEAIYNNLKVREAGVRKWPKDVVQEVKQKTSEVVCLLLDPKTVNVIHTFLISDMTKTSTEAMHNMASPEAGQTVRMILKYRRIDGAEPLDSATLVVADEEQDVDKSGFLSISEDDGDDSEDVEVDAKVTPSAVGVTLSKNDTTEIVAEKEQNQGNTSPKGNESVGSDGGHSVSDSSTFSSRSIKEKRRRKRELEARRITLSPSLTKVPPAVGGFSLSRFFSRQNPPAENRENPPA